ncbi:hypothetical protein GMORB2_4261 [Geosmithia morbida]|uniref:TPR repeat-containing protein n=1 Tax=Geosmithia morbida TaxID=1094350 RepID=A0A9P4YYH5_9HYPO|nr:uncharacterized protein GMORB2_4261 [Geosmithia morbida]KAF4125421.1 hypothetical protein GMORB2_4261 [Geosmithia morbida]
MASLDAFLQTNVTGPVLPDSFVSSIQHRFTEAHKASSPGLRALRTTCLDYLEVDGVSPYAYMPYPELFSLAKYIITTVLADAPAVIKLETPERGEVKYSMPWARLRIDTWHYKLLTQPSLGHGSNFTKSSQWSDAPSLAGKIAAGIVAVSSQILGDDEVWATSGGEDEWSADDKALFLVEAANYYILLGRNDLTRDLLTRAAKMTHLEYALSGAMGKRTRYQEKSTSQMVVLARSNTALEKSSENDGDDEENSKPDALQLNDDTLLENIHFTKEKTADGLEPKEDILPPALAELSPDNQPQLSPLDQIILLTEATLKDAFSPVDTLTSEEIMPYAVRVLADKSTNWQIYTLALLVRSRIELHRSRTLERGVLQLQAVADQVLADTTAVEKDIKEEKEKDADTDVPAIQVTQADPRSAAPAQDKPTSFLPAPKASESAPAHVRLQYIHSLSTPPRWHLESELAFAWVSVGSLASALEIFKRLRLWAEVALCFASRAAVEDEDGRGGGGEDKARGIIRWRLFQRTGSSATPGESDADSEDDIADVTQLRGDDFSGPERTPAPPNAARLWCILGDIESQPAHYERAWEVSNHRYARAQRSLGEHYVAKRDWERAREAYNKATSVNRLNSDMWSRLGDINLGLASFEQAAEAYSRAISCATDLGGGEGAKTWSNLGSALWSLYLEVIKEKCEDPIKEEAPREEEEEDDMTTLNLDDNKEMTISRKDPARLLSQALSAYKRGASIAHDNWRIWDNVLTLSARIKPPPVAEVVLAMRHILRIRATEDAIDTDVLSVLVRDVVLAKDLPSTLDKNDVLPRGSPERLVVRMVEEDVVPLITRRSDLWSLVSRVRAWTRDYAGAIDAAERAWRAAMGSSSGGLSAASSGADGVDWTTDKEAWAVVVDRTDELASMLENWGSDVEAIGPKWKGRVRSAVRSVLGRAKESWEGTSGWVRLQGIMDGLKT